MSQDELNFGTEFRLNNATALTVNFTFTTTCAGRPKTSGLDATRSATRSTSQRIRAEGLPTDVQHRSHAGRT